ncbi:redox-regulated ATPase YchF [Candidatus Micrarchaeota archaeon]|nr:redox-regulated ATPase YchF [Candidatus Micrarchaeota archaeon]
MLIGVVGKPSTGKSTFFQALTSIPVERSARPFTTIKPNRGVAYVEVECVDKDFGVQCNPRTGFCINSRRFAPVEILDVAGLVPGAHEGKGLGNKFLDDLRQADVLIHIVDVSGSTNEVGEAVATGSYDPANDIKFLEEELNYWIEGILDANWQKLARESALNKKNEDLLVGQLSGLGLKRGAIQKTLKQLGLEEKKISEWTEEEKFKFARLIREIGKQIVIAANKCDLSNGMENYEKLKKQFPQYLIVPCSAEAEIALKGAAKNGFIDYIPGDVEFKIIKELNEPQKKAMDLLTGLLKKFGSSGVQKLLNASVFDFLHYFAVFAGGRNKLADKDGNILPDVWLLPPNSTAIDFAAAIHTEFAKKFIKAVDAHTGMTHGADHPLKHRDVIEFMFGR